MPLTDTACADVTHPAAAWHAGTDLHPAGWYCVTCELPVPVSADA